MPSKENNKKNITFYSRGKKILSLLQNSNNECEENCNTESNLINNKTEKSVNFVNEKTDKGPDFVKENADYLPDFVIENTDYLPHFVIEYTDNLPNILMERIDNLSNFVNEKTDNLSNFMYATTEIQIENNGKINLYDIPIVPLEEAKIADPNCEINISNNNEYCNNLADKRCDSSITIFSNDLGPELDYIFADSADIGSFTVIQPQDLVTSQGECTDIQQNISVPSPQNSIDKDDPSFQPSSPGSPESDTTMPELEFPQKRKLPNKMRERNKKLRMEGKAYTGFKKNDRKITQDFPRNERKMKSTCNSPRCLTSSKILCSTFDEDSRLRIFNEFWGTMNWGERKVFVRSHVCRKPTATKSKEDSRREGTFTYFLNNGKERLQVCRKMFINTLDIGYKTVQEWVNKSQVSGTSTNNINLRSEVSKRFRVEFNNLNEFFKKLPKMPAHYCRRDSTKLYLEDTYKSLTDLYRVYVNEFCKDCKPLSRTIFSRMFKKHNLSLFQQKKDQCNICFAHKKGNITEIEWKTHVDNKNKARNTKNKDKEAALNGECICLTMDLQAVKLSPQLPAGKIYFKTKLCCHNFTIFNLATRDVTCYWFSEDQNNQLVSSTFTSCIIDYLESKNLSINKLPIIIYSDGCGYQNRNNVLANALLNFAITNNIVVFQKYLEPGHTQMECDSVHSVIEKKLKNREIYLPSDYAAVTKEARLNPKPYETKILDYSFFKNFAHSKNLRYSSIRPGKKASDPVVTDIKCIKYSPKGTIQIMLDYDQDFIDLPVRAKTLPPILEYPQLHKEPCKIKLEKWKHLQDLKTVLPKDTHGFYDSLLHE